MIRRALLTLLAALACRDASRAEAAALARSGGAPRLHVTLLAPAGDPRVPVVREALAHWNGEPQRLGRRVTMDSGTVRAPAVADALLRAAGGEARFGFGPATWRLRRRLSATPGDIVVALSGTDLVSYGSPSGAGHPAIVVLRVADRPPLSLPNALRNVAAHELGHALGLEHNGDPATLMCGRPAACRPSAFVSPAPRFFPLTPEDERRLQARWP